MNLEVLQIQKPIDIEKYDSLVGNQGVIASEQSLPQMPQRKDLQILQSLAIIQRNLSDFEYMLNQYGKEIAGVDIEFDDQQSQKRRQDQLRKAMACKLKTLSELSHKFDARQYKLQQDDLEQKFEQSLVNKQKYYLFASNQQLQIYCRNVDPPPPNDKIYANFYHDRFADLHQKLFYQVVLKNYELELVKENTDKILVILLNGKNTNYCSLSHLWIEIYEKILYSFLEQFQNQNICNHILSFKYVNDKQQFSSLCQNAIEIPLLFVQLVYELIINPHGSMETYYTFIKRFLVDKTKDKFKNKLDSNTFQLVVKKSLDPAKVFDL